MDKTYEELRATIVLLETGVAELEREAATARDLEKRLEYALDATTDGVWDWNIETGEVLFSRSWLTSLGYEIGELPPHVSSWEKLVHPEDMPRLEELLQEHFDGKTEIYRFTNRLRRKSGKYRWNLDRGKVVERNESGMPVRMVGVDVDIDHVVEMATQLGVVETRNKAFVDAIPDVLIRLSGDLVILDFSATELGMPIPERVIGRALGDVGQDIGFVPEDFENAHETVAKVLESGIVERREVSFQGLKYFELRIAPAGEDEVLVLGRDITEHKRAEEQNEKLEAKIQQTQKLESLGVLAGGIAHDFNNLLVGILLNVESAMEKLLDACPAREDLEQVEQAALRAAEVTNQLLAYSGRGRFEKKQFDLSVLVEQMIQLLRVSVSKSAVMRSELACDLPAIEGDPNQICQVVMNLVTNASDALGDKPGEITIETGLAGTAGGGDREMTEGDYIYLEISDTGCGMDTETQGKIFDPFFTTHGLGRGLGLAALQGIVRGHHGFVELESELGRGTTFRISFPALSMPVETAKEERPSSDQWNSSGAILVADDEAVVRGAVERILTGRGFEVLIARDGVEAVEVFREHSESIRVVLLDLTMPRMGGAEALDEMRHICPSVRVVLTSGFDSEDVAARFSGKLLSFLHKPFGTQDLIAKVREVLER